MLNVLVVDDSPIDRVLLEGLLKKDSELFTLLVPQGENALERMVDFSPDVVVTDLNMPGMNGLQLISTLRLRFPQVPVILITSQGHANTALEALQHGAASYVPKSQLQQSLTATIHEVASRFKSDHSYEKLTQCMQHATMHFSVPCDFHVHQRLVELLGQMAASVGIFSSDDQIRIETAWEEGLRYMQLRGNYELGEAELRQLNLRNKEGQQLLNRLHQQAPHNARVLQVTFQVDATAARVKIVHEGAAFTAPAAASICDTTALEDLAHRGLVIMRSFLDEVEFHPESKALVLVQRRTTNAA